MNRGSARIDDLDLQSDLASMRPRFMNRGSNPSPRTSSATCSRFNEAPIHESGKCDAARARSVGGSSFNEAPIHESGK